MPGSSRCQRLSELSGREATGNLSSWVTLALCREQPSKSVGLGDDCFSNGGDGIQWPLSALSLTPLGLLAANLLSQWSSLVFGFSAPIQALAVQCGLCPSSICLTWAPVRNVESWAPLRLLIQNLHWRSPGYSCAHERLRNTALTHCLCATYGFQVCSRKLILVAFRWPCRIASSFQLAWDFPSISTERITSQETS